MGVVALPALRQFDPRYQRAVEGTPQAGEPVEESEPAYGHNRVLLRRARVKPQEGDYHD